MDVVLADDGPDVDGVEIYDVPEELSLLDEATGEILMARDDEASGRAASPPGSPWSVRLSTAEHPFGGAGVSRSR